MPIALSPYDGPELGCQFERVEEPKSGTRPRTSYMCNAAATHIWTHPQAQILLCQKCADWLHLMESLGLPT